MLQTFSLFVACICFLLVFAVAYLAAWTMQREATYWRTWACANLLIASAFAILLSVGTIPFSIAAPAGNVILTLAYALRWGAARAFSERRLPWWICAALPVLTFLASIAPPLDADDLHILACAAMAFLIAATAWEFWRDRQDGLPSRYGLAASYAIAAVVMLARVAEGLTTGYSMGADVPAGLSVSIALIAHLLHTAGAGAFSLSLALEKKVANLKRLSLTDELTDLPNRRAFGTRLGAVIADGVAPVTVAIVDIDHFKAINDQHGHAAGDEALRTCARILSRSLGARAFLARTGGEEFGVLLVGATSAEARAIFEHARAEVAATALQVGDVVIRMTISIGIEHAERGLTDADTALRSADASLYRAKREGRNRIMQAA